MNKTAIFLLLFLSSSLVAKRSDEGLIKAVLINDSVTAKENLEAGADINQKIFKYCDPKKAGAFLEKLEKLEESEDQL